MKPVSGAPPGAEPLSSAEVRTLWAAAWAAHGSIGGGCTYRQLSDLTGRTYASLYRPIHSLLARGWLTSGRIGNDVRRGTLRPTLVMTARPPS